MDWDKFVRLLAAFLGFIGSALVTYSAMGVSPEDQLKLAQAFWDYNPYLIEVIAHEKADKITGFNFIAASFVSTALSLFVPKDVKPSSGWFILLGTATGILITVAWLFGENFYQNQKADMTRLVQEHVQIR